MHATLALHWLHNDRARLLVHKGVQSGHVVERRGDKPRHERSERLLVLWVIGGRQRAQGTPVECVRERNDAVLFLRVPAALLCHELAPLAGELERALVGFRAGIGEENLAGVEPGRGGVVADGSYK
ncbi:hypothetical protein BC938DRAFT_474763 [Jimgerdemannia flammicorona]|uniref:Uncharacterized protein n=1 Tax=Jimgerdemannia flammicorona TaxID=994334 RepID=A0A433Q1K6_9FUNG|nr:hypothetical protein BC938DRAFT_474763 [Jimgerdemannia flammicorona]